LRLVETNSQHLLLVIDSVGNKPILAMSAKAGHYNILNGKLIGMKASPFARNSVLLSPDSVRDGKGFQTTHWQVKRAEKKYS
jgi:hypothetical protein